MTGKGEGEGDGLYKLGEHIALVKYVLVFTNAIEWMIGVSVVVLCLWLRFQGGFEEWLDILNAKEFYIGVYILIISSLIVIIVSFLGCISALQESSTALLGYIVTQAVSFILGLTGAAVLLDNSARDSRLQPRIRESMRNMIMNPHVEKSKQTLAMIQENIACCGADGANDYLLLRQPLPTECRDTVTGNPFYHGCVDELTWFFEEKCGWVAGLVMTLCMLHVINIVLSIILSQALKKEEENATYAK